MNLRKLHQRLVLVAVAGSFALGCELIVDFDRTLIPVDATDSASPSVDATIDTTLDAFHPDTSVAQEAGKDSSTVDAADASPTDAADASDGD